MAAPLAKRPAPAPFRTPRSTWRPLPPLCRIAQVQGVNLWTARAKNATIDTVISYLEPYLSDPRSWSKEQISDFPNDGLYYLAYAGMGLKKPEYIALFRKLERSDSSWLGLIDLRRLPLGGLRSPDAPLKFRRVR